MQWSQHNCHDCLRIEHSDYFNIPLEVTGVGCVNGDSDFWITYVEYDVLGRKYFENSLNPSDEVYYLDEIGNRERVSGFSNEFVFYGEAGKFVASEESAKLGLCDGKIYVQKGVRKTYVVPCKTVTESF